jgi:3-hydroxy-9,10-secoandrosta-1,3,5(10)-triene-9,17-dione monooxygenase
LELVAVVRERADAAEKDRRLPRETIADLRRIGLLRAFVPRSYGGDERPLSEVLDAITELAVGCASTAWVGSLLAIHNLAVCWLDAQGQDEIFGEGPDVLISSSVAPTGRIVRADGGFRLAGKWGFSSGVDHADWIMLGANLGVETPSPGTTDYYFCFVPRSRARLIDDWHVAGLRASGSKSVELDDVFVPEYRALPMKMVGEGKASGHAVHAKPLYHMPWYPVFVSAFPAAALGTAIATLEAVREFATARASRAPGQRPLCTAGTGARIAEAAAQIDAARMMFRRDLAALDRCGGEGRLLRPGLSERIAYDAAFIVDQCSRAVLELFRKSGGRVLHESNPIQRHFRDIHAMTQHRAIDLEAAGEAYGRTILSDQLTVLGARD